MADVETPAAPAPVRPRWCSRLFAPFVAMARRPGRTALVVLLLLLIGGSLTFAGVFLYAQSQLNAAVRETRRGHNGAALRHLLVCNQLLPDHPLTLLLSARIARRSGNSSEAEQFLDRYWELRGDDDDLTLERLLMRASRGEVELIAPLLEQHWHDEPDKAELCFEAAVMGSLYRFQYKQAASLLDRWQKDFPDSVIGHWLRGRMNEQMDRETDARASYREVLQRDAEHDEARLRLVELLIRVNQAEEALPHLDTLSKRLESGDLLPNRARALESLGRMAEARDALDAALKHNPNNAQALADRGRLARLDGELVESERLLRQAVGLDTGNITTRYQLSLTLAARGKHDEAKKEQTLVRTIEDDMARIRTIVNTQLQQRPNDPALHYEVAMIALRSGLPAEVHRWLLSGLQADPNHLPTHRALATYYFEMGEPILSARHRIIAQRLAGKTP